MIRDADREGASRAMDAYARGDAHAFGQLYDALAPHLFRFALRIAGSAGAAEDIVQQTFLVMHRSRDRWVRGAAVFPWAYAIAHHLLVDELRRSRHAGAGGSDSEADRDSGEPPPDAVVDARRRLSSALSRIRTLPENHRVAFQLVVLEGLSVAEAADVLGTSRGNVKVQVHRAREALRSGAAAADPEGDAVAAAARRAL